MSSYKRQLLDGLMERGWEQVAIVTTDIDWWVDEAWTIQSRRKRWGFELTVAFLVDPMWEGPRKKGQGVYLIAAGEGVPSGRLGAQKGVCLRMNEGRFDDRLSNFFVSIDWLRDGGPLHWIRYYAEAMASDELFISRTMDHGEFRCDWDATWSPLAKRRDDLSPRVFQAAQRLNGLVREIANRQQSIGELVARPGWPEVRATASALLAVLDEEGG